MNKLDGIVGFLLIALVLPLLVILFFVTLIVAAYVTVMISAWLFGNHLDWSVIDILSLPYSDVAVVVNANWLLYILTVIVVFLVVWIVKPRNKE